ncbi:MAG: carboxypeptidase-like regulatory domain-containing protein, partial [Anaerolineales bacterium]
PDQIGGVLGSPGLRAWIDRPLEGSTYTQGEEITIRWHASGTQGIELVEIRINGETFFLAADIDSSSQLVTQEIYWNPITPGEYLIEVIPSGIDGSIGQAAVNHVTILGGGGDVMGVIFADLNDDGRSDSTGEGPLGGVSVTLSVCVDIISTITDADGRFHFENLPYGLNCILDFAKVGWRTTVIQPGYPNIPLSFVLDSNQAEYTIYMAPQSTPTTMKGTSTYTPQSSPTSTPSTPTSTPTLIAPSPTSTFTSTPTKSPKPPTPDTFGPPKPYVIGPKENEIVDCPSPDGVILQWQEPSDPSGIASYWVELFISHDSGGNWNLVKSWETITSTHLDVDDQTDCGNMYVWKVSARDGAGNLGAYELSQFRTGLP